ncbi:MAG: transaldolase [Thermodesulfobacteriota bacterium]|nr:transaldolase [Thermodesulfobacteriota bacterium]
MRIANKGERDMEKNRTMRLREFGQSLWLDNIQRSELMDGTLKRMIDEDGLSGLTSNPTIFMKSITQGKEYEGQIKELSLKGKKALEIYDIITTDDIKKACNIMMEVYNRTKGDDGFVSIELDPRIAYDAKESIKEAKMLFNVIDSPNLMVKVPGTKDGLPVIRELTSEGININVTLLFSPKQYEEVASAYIKGLEQRKKKGESLKNIRSVASFFVSRIDSKVDKRIDALIKEADSCDRRDDLTKLRGKTAVKIVHIVYRKFKEMFLSPSFQYLIDKGGKIQRPLWASTGTKDSTYSDVKYVDSLIGPNTVNTLPPATIDAFRDHGVLKSSLEEDMEETSRIVEMVEAAGIDLEMIYDELLDEGVKAFEKSYNELIDAIEERRKKIIRER